MLNGLAILCKNGDHFILPNDVKEWSFDGQLEMIVSHPNED